MQHLVHIRLLCSQDWWQESANLRRWGSETIVCFEDSNLVHWDSKFWQNWQWLAMPDGIDALSGIYLFARRLGHRWPTSSSPDLNLTFRFRLTSSMENQNWLCMQQTNCGMHTSLWSHKILILKINLVVFFERNQVFQRVASYLSMDKYKSKSILFCRYGNNSELFCEKIIQRFVDPDYS